MVNSLFEDINKFVNDSNNEFNFCEDNSYCSDDTKEFFNSALEAFNKGINLITIFKIFKRFFFHIAKRSLFYIKQFFIE